MAPFRFEQSTDFQRWLARLDRQTVYKIMAVILRLQNGLGDTKRIKGTKFEELRIHVGPGYRVYFYRSQGVVIFLLAGGDKGTQSRDIAKAKDIFKGLEK